jgi:DNA-directed RNA polymerase I subunit RPA1
MSLADLPFLDHLGYTLPQEMYGGEVAGKLLSSFSRLFTGYLQWYGFTCGFDDLLLTGKSEQARKVGAGCGEGG